MHFNGQNQKKCRKRTLIIFRFYIKISSPTFLRAPLGWESDIISKNSQGKKLWHISKFSYRSYKIFGMVRMLNTKKKSGVCLRHSVAHMTNPGCVSPCKKASIFKKSTFPRKFFLLSMDSYPKIALLLGTIVRLEGCCWTLISSS